MSTAELFPEDLVVPLGVAVFRGWLDLTAQRKLLDAVHHVLAQAPPYRLTMKNGTPLINRMSNCGPLGWHSDAKGYRYVATHPHTGLAWPPIPAELSALAEQAALRCGVHGYQPDACLVNLYDPKGRLSLHRDHDECNFAWPIVSISLGAEAVFMLGGQQRADPVTDIRLYSGDVVVLHGASRTRFHGVRRILPGTSPLAHPTLPPSGRLNLTCRRAM